MTAPGIITRSALRRANRHRPGARSTSPNSIGFRPRPESGRQVPRPLRIAPMRGRSSTRMSRKRVPASRAKNCVNSRSIQRPGAFLKPPRPAIARWSCTGSCGRRSRKHVQRGLRNCSRPAPQAGGFAEMPRPGGQPAIERMSDRPRFSFHAPVRNSLLPARRHQLQLLHLQTARNAVGVLRRRYGDD